MSDPLNDFEELFAEETRANPTPCDLKAGFLRTRDVAKFRHVIDTDGSETALDHLLRGDPNLWSAFLHQNRTGHHGGMVLSQQVIRPAVPGVQAGLIPDFLIGGESSDGWSWWVVELKSANEQVFAGAGNTLRLGETANKGILQLLRYLDFCAEHQSVLRDMFKLEGFREPRGILLIGRQDEFQASEERRKMKRAWNQSNHLLEIRTYDAFLRSLEHKLYFHGFRSDDPPPLLGDES